MRLPMFLYKTDESDDKAPVKVDDLTVDQIDDLGKEGLEKIPVDDVAEESEIEIVPEVEAKAKADEKAEGDEKTGDDKETADAEAKAKSIAKLEDVFEQCRAREEAFN